MKATVHAVGKVSKKLGASSAAAVIEGLEDEPIVVTSKTSPNRPTPNSAHMHALWLGVGAAIAKGATELEVYSPSKNAVKATDGTGKADYETRLDAFEAAYVIYWTRELEAAGGSWSIAHLAAAEMPEAVEAAAKALKAKDRPEPVQMPLAA